MDKTQKHGCHMMTLCVRHRVNDMQKPVPAGQHNKDLWKGCGTVQICTNWYCDMGVKIILLHELVYSKCWLRPGLDLKHMHDDASMQQRIMGPLRITRRIIIFLLYNCSVIVFPLFTEQTPPLSQTWCAQHLWLAWENASLAEEIWESAKAAQCLREPERERAGKPWDTCQYYHGVEILSRKLQQNIAKQNV